MKSDRDYNNHHQRHHIRTPIITGWSQAGGREAIAGSVQRAIAVETIACAVSAAAGKQGFRDHVPHHAASRTALWPERYGRWFTAPQVRDPSPGMLVGFS